MKIKMKKKNMKDMSFNFQSHCDGNENDFLV